MADLRDELDASVLCGSGYICVVGPPSSGKTSLVLEYLVARERHFNAEHLVTEEEEEEEHTPVFCMKYMSARSTANDLLSCLSRQLQPDANRRRRLSYDCTPLEFGAAVVRWLDAHPPASELHIVLDDADLLEYEVGDMNLWLSHALPTAAAQSRLVVLWIVSQRPLRIADSTRFHVVSRPSVQDTVAWLQRAFTMERELAAEADSDEETDRDGIALYCAPDGALTLSASEVNRTALEAFAYYAERQPMHSSVVSRDVHYLTQRVYEVLPPLLLASVEGGGRRLDARDFAAAWGSHRGETASTSSKAAAQQDQLVLALKRLGYSAVLLAFAAFYGGAVPKRKQHLVFGRPHGEGRRAPVQEAKGQSHKAAVLSASVHVLKSRRLAFLYDAMLHMCTPHIDPLEFAAAEVALQYVPGFVTWGLLTPVTAQRHRAYHCWIPVSTAQQLAQELSLSLFDLIPA